MGGIVYTESARKVAHFVENAERNGLPVVLFVLPPLALIVVIGQRLQAPGPLLHVRPRLGMGGRSFRMATSTVSSNFAALVSLTRRTAASGL